MIRKCISIENIGRYHNHQAYGDQRFERVTLIYSPNGNGKTTLADIFRSFAESRGAPIEARQTIGREGSPSAKILFGDTPANYGDGSWDRGIEATQFEDIKIFDSTFVHENVFAGDVVEHRQKANLYQFIIGEKGVELIER